MSTASIIINTPIKNFCITQTGDSIAHTCWTTEAVSLKETTNLLKTAIQQIEAYFAGTLQNFTLPLSYTGTPFQLKVWEALLKIPYGKTVSYQEIAQSIGHQNAHRAVGSANHHNRICLLIPCHRVVLASGKLGGYAGGQAIKEKLLTFEKENNIN